MANLSSEILTTIDNTAAVVVTNVYGAFALTFQPFVRTMLIVSVIAFGLSMMMGWIEYPIRQFAKNLFKWVTVTTLTFNWAAFNLFLFALFSQSPNEIGGIALTAITGDDYDDISGLIGEVMHTGMIAAAQAYDGSGYIMPFVLGTIIFISIVLVCAYSLGLIAISKIGMAVVLALGPIFLIMLMFESTKQMFASFIQQLFNFAFVGILTYIILTFLLQLIENSLKLVGPDPVLGDIVPLCISAILTIFVLAQVTGIASGLAGGIQVGTMGAMAALSRSVSRMEPTQSIKNTYSNMKGGYRGMKNLTSRFTPTKNNALKRKV